MTNKKLLLISNTKSALEHKWGQHIDNWNGTVCRYNLFEIEGFEKYVGTRCEYFLMRSCDDIPKRSPELFQHVYLFIPHCNLMSAMRNVAHQYIQHYGIDKTTVVDTNITYKLHRKLGLQKREKCSVGIMSVYYFIMKGYDINLLGWTQDKPNHYFKRQPIDSQLHNFDKERQYLAELEKGGLVKHVRFQN